MDLAKPNPSPNNNAQSIIDNLPKPILYSEHEIGDGGHMAVPEKFKLIDLEVAMAAPRRAKGTVTLDDDTSFVSYVNAMGGAPIFCTIRDNQQRPEFVAVFNGHAGPNEPGWGDLRAVFGPTPSVEWARWTKSNGQLQEQAAFATWLEDNAKDIAEAPGCPTAAQMLEMALSFESTQDARLRSSIRLQNGGVELTYVNKEDEATVQKMRMFDRFAIGIAPFRGGTNYEIKARLRYRVRDSKVHFWYELIRSDLVLEDAVKDLATRIQIGTDSPLYYGFYS